MATGMIQQQTLCQDEFTKNNSVIVVQHVFRQQFGINGRGLAPSRDTILNWVRNWHDTGSVQYIKNARLVKMC